jgi:hypothetical protein
MPAPGSVDGGALGLSGARQLAAVGTQIVERIGPQWAWAWRWGIALWVASRLGMVVATYFGVLLTSSGMVATPGQLVDAWKRWDANWYVQIATRGYDSPQPTAFFPLFPLLISALHAILPWLTYFGCALVLSNSALLAALVLLVHLTEREFGSAVASNTALLFLAYPAAFFLSTAYAEAVFLAFVLGAFGALRAGRWPLAGLLAALATLTRPTGGMLIFAFGWEYLRQSPLTWADLRSNGLAILSSGGPKKAARTLVVRLLAMAGMPLAVGLYSGYLWWRFGQPLLFKKVEGAYWQHVRASPISGLVQAVRPLIHSPLTTYVDARGLLDVVPILLFLGVMVVGLRQLPLAYTLYGLAVIALSLTAPIPGNWPLQSGIRYLLPAFPVFIVLALLGQRWPAIRTLLLYSWLPLQGILIFLFLHGQWII